MTPDIAALADTIRQQYDCPCTFLRTRYVRHTHKDRLLWEGAVAIFLLESPAAELECYAWESDSILGTRRTITFLKSGEIDSPEAAVRMQILDACVPLSA